METMLLQQQFARMGARLQIAAANGPRARTGIDIGGDRRGTFFDIRIRPDDPVEYEVVDLRPDVRHLLLLARRPDAKEKYLCGHDERHWFVCAVPGQRGTASVATAMAALQPAPARFAAERSIRRPQDRLRRRNAAFVRQGEWFFMPTENLAVNERLVRRNEPISRGRGSKPHMCQFVYRHGGEMVMVCSRMPGGVTIAQYERLVQAKPDAARWNWRPMQRNAAVYARGRVSHPDHKTIVLDIWHRVLMNTEGEAPGSRNVVFLD